MRFGFYNVRKIYIFCFAANSETGLCLPRDSCEGDNCDSVMIIDGGATIT